MKPAILIFIAMIIALTGCICILTACSPEPKEAENMEKNTGKFILKSAFGNNERIPDRYTCKGNDISPPLNFENIPKEAKTIALIMDDPDAPSGTWDHWILWNIDIKNSIEENSIPSGAVQGRNSWGKNEYGGPCPPSGTHRYSFRAYALDTKITLSKGAGKEELIEAMKTHIIAKAELIGMYGE